MKQYKNKATKNILFFISCLLTMSGCSEEMNDFPNLADVGDRPKFPDVYETIESQDLLKKDRRDLLNNLPPSS